MRFYISIIKFKTFKNKKLVQYKWLSIFESYFISNSIYKKLYFCIILFSCSFLESKLEYIIYIWVKRSQNHFFSKKQIKYQITNNLTKVPLQVKAVIKIYRPVANFKIILYLFLTFKLNLLHLLTINILNYKYRLLFQKNNLPGWKFSIILNSSIQF